MTLPPAPENPLTDDQRRRVAAVFGLTLLEVLRAQDRPDEVLEDEDVSVTMPRRLGLSDVVDRQIRNYQEAVRKRRRMTDAEARDLVQLVVRRPDSEDVFRVAGGSLAGKEGRGRRGARLQRVLPRGLAFALARRRVGRRLRVLFGRRVGGFVAGPFALEGRNLIFIQSDPGGDACHFLSGLAQVVLDRAVGGSHEVVHAQCQGRGDPVCRWTVTSDVVVRDREQVGDLILSPELETG
jgi:hypothetical protein